MPKEVFKENMLPIFTHHSTTKAHLVPSVHTINESHESTSRTVMCLIYDNCTKLFIDLRYNLSESLDVTDYDTMVNVELA